jgi:hypothetical protein
MNCPYKNTGFIDQGCGLALGSSLLSVSYKHFAKDPDSSLAF